MKPLSTDTCYPQSFDVSSPTPEIAEYLADPGIRLLVEFFQSKGLESLKQEEREEGWYQDWIDYQARHRLYASLLSPKQYSSLGHQFEIVKLTRFLEVFAYFSPAHAYSLHVSFLGLFPILMSSNESLKQEAITKLECGGLFAFAISERTHGSDLYANEFSVRPDGAAGLVANGKKYYIGNANAACMISILARKDADAPDATKRSPFVFFVLRPQESPALQNVRKIRTLGIRNAFVGEFEVNGHPVKESDVISEGRSAWDAVFGTVNLGKFFLGYGAVGICEHAFAEAIHHLSQRILFGKPVTEMPHIRSMVILAFARLTAMKLYAYRALAYLRAASKLDRRYLLFNAVQKARVSTEGVKVMGLLSECISARGFETETYFETALCDIQLIPSLEGSTHINFGLIAPFIDNYFARPDGDGPGPVEDSSDGGENPYWMEARNRNPKTVRFAHFLLAYKPLRAIPNVRLFMKQAKAFCRFTVRDVSMLKSSADADLLISIGKCFSIIAYAQMVAEKCLAMSISPQMVSVIFHALIEDLSADALKLAALFTSESLQRRALKRVVRVPESDAADFKAVFDFMAARYGNVTST